MESIKINDQISNRLQELARQSDDSGIDEFIMLIKNEQRPEPEEINQNYENTM